MGRVPQWLIRTKSDEQAVADGCYFDEQAALKVKRFIETYCVQSKAPFNGKPLRILDWQWRDVLAPIYGLKKPDGSRLKNRALVFVGKKNGKSSLCAALSLYHLLEQAGSEVACIASDIQQANVLYSQAADFVELCPQLAKRLWVRRNIKKIQDDKSKSVLSVLSSKPEGKSGFSLNYCAYDEILEWSPAHAREIYDRLSKAGMARKDSLQIVISTANHCTDGHIGAELFKSAQDLIAGTIVDVNTQAVVYSLDANEDWTKPENWWRCKPCAAGQP